MQGSGGASRGIERTVKGPKWGLAWLFPMLAVLLLVSFYSYPVFHTLAELFCMVVAASIFVFVLHLRGLQDNDYLLFVGLGLLLFLVLGIPHILGYTGVQLLPGFDNDLPTQAHILQRLFLASSFLAAPAFLDRRLRLGPVFAGLAALATLSLASLLVWRNFPQMYVPGVGLTALKQAAELALTAIFVAAGWSLARHHAAFDARVLRILLVAIGCFAVSELFFTSYATPFAPANLVGHLIQVTGFYLLYRAVLVSALENPLRTLFREVSEQSAENEQLYKEEALRTERMSLLKELADAGASTLSSGELGRRQIALLTAALRPKTALVLLADAVAGVLVPLANVGYEDDYIAKHFGTVEIDGPGLSARVFRTREASIIEDVETDPTLTDAARAFNRFLGLRSGASIPLLAGHMAMGVLSLGWQVPHPIDEDESEFLSAVASQIALGLRNARLHDAQQLARQIELQRASRLSSLRQIAEDASSSLELPEVAARIVDSVASLFGAQQVQLRLVNEDRTLLESAACADRLDGYLTRLGPMPVDGEFETAACFRCGRPSFASDVSPSTVAPSSQTNVAQTGIRSYALLPLSAGGETIGTFYLGWVEPRELAAEERDFLEAVAGQFVTGLQNARLYRAQLEARAQVDAELATTRMLLDAAQALSTSIDLDDVLLRFAAAALRVTGLGRAFVNLIDMQQQVLIPVVATAGLVSPAGDRVPFEQLSITSRKAILAQETAILDYDRPEIPAHDREIAASNKARQVLFVPLLVAGEIVGHIAVDEIGVRHEFSPREIELVEALSAQAAIVVRNARLIESARGHARLDRAIAECATALAEALDPDPVLPGVLEMAAEALSASGAMLSRREPGGWRVAAARGVPREMIGTFHSEDSTPTLRRLLDTRLTQSVLDIAQAEESVHAAVGQMGHRAFVIAPVLYRDEVVAALTLFFREARSPLSEAELNVLRRVAFMIGVTQENSRLYEREHRIAETLQAALLALPEQLPGIEYASEYLSATDSERVGGDFYDLFELGQDHIGITIGDVSGKGLNAAVVTSLVKNTIRAHAAEKGKTPRQILELTNDVVHQGTPIETFATVFFAMLDRRDGRLVYANAGHTTAAMIHTDGEVAGLRVTGPLLGAFPGLEYRQGEATMEPGAVLFLYTDGLTEARRDGVLYGEERLIELLGALRGSSTGEMLGRVVEDVMEYSSNELRDDLAIIAVKRLPRGPETPGQLKLTV